MPTPSSQIKLLKNVDIKNDYVNTFLFDTVIAQENFFTLKAITTKGNLSYVRKEGNVIRYDGDVDDVRDISYLMFKNDDYSTKWFYAFVTDVKWVGRNVVNIEFEIDVMQSWWFELNIKSCYVEREHVSNDSVGLHRLDEGLNVGQVTVNSMEEIDDIKDIVIIIGTTIDPTERDSQTNKFVDVQGDIYSYLYSGLSLFQVTKSQLNLIIEQFALEGQSDGLKVIFTVPRNMVADYDPTTFRLDAPIPVKVTYPVTPAYVIDGYSPKNNKLKVFPYNFIEVINNQGGSVNYRYEDFNLSGGNMLFEYTCGLAPNPTIMLRPQDYNGIYEAYNEGISLSGFPLCSWTSDLYNNWKAQNQVSNALGIGQGALSLGTGVATGNIIGAFAGIQSIASSIGSFYEKSILPNPLSGSTSGSDSIASETLTFTFLKKSVRYETAKVIDNFFTRFGYKVNELKVPNLSSRVNWNYIKCSETNIFGDINGNDLKKINDIFKNGVTFWHNDVVGNYSLSNPTI